MDHVQELSLFDIIRDGVGALVTLCLPVFFHFLEALVLLYRGRSQAAWVRLKTKARNNYVAQDAYNLSLGERVEDGGVILVEGVDPWVSETHVEVFATFCHHCTDVMIAKLYRSCGVDFKSCCLKGSVFTILVS